MRLRINRHHVLVLYRDPTVLEALSRPGCVGRTPDWIVLVPRARSGEDPSLARALSEAEAAGHRSVAAVMHVDDLSPTDPGLAAVDRVRLLWNPADVADDGIARAVHDLECSPAADAVGPDAVYFAVGDRPVSSVDWLRAVADPVLSMLSDMPRRRRMRAGDPLTGLAGLQLVEAPRTRWAEQVHHV